MTSEKDNVDTIRMTMSILNYIDRFFILLIFGAIGSAFIALTLSSMLSSVTFTFPLNIVIPLYIGFFFIIYSYYYLIKSRRNLNNKIEKSYQNIIFTDKTYQDNFNNLKKELNEIIETDAKKKSKEIYDDVLKEYLIEINNNKIQLDKLTRQREALEKTINLLESNIKNIKKEEKS